MELNIDRRKLIIIIVIVAIALLVVIVGGWLFWRQGANPAGPDNTTAPPVNSLPVNKPVPLPVLTPEEERHESVVRLARLFAERFGTFSNQSRYEGIGDILPITTDSFRRWINETYLPELKQQGAGETYAGQTTKVMSVIVDNISDNDSQVSVSVQRATTDESGVVKTEYPTLKLTLVKENDVWLIDGAIWDNQQ